MFCCSVSPVFWCLFIGLPSNLPDMTGGQMVFREVDRSIKQIKSYLISDTPIHVVPLLPQNNLRFQQDIARSHEVRICHNFITDNDINPLQWLQYSHNLSCSEYLLDQLERHVQQHHPPPVTIRTSQPILLSLRCMQR